MQDSERRPDHEFEKSISTGPYARSRDEPIGQTEQGLPDDPGKPVEITSEELGRRSQDREKILGE